jgi:hypothetical protein
MDLQQTYYCKTLIIKLLDTMHAILMWIPPHNETASCCPLLPIHYEHLKLELSH